MYVSPPRSRTTRDAPASTAARPASMTCSKFEPSSSPSRAMTATSGLGRSVVMSIVGLPRRGRPQQLGQGGLVPSVGQDTVVQPVRQRPREMDPHPAERPLLERQVQAGLRNGPRIERRGTIAEADLDRIPDPGDADLDRPVASPIAMLDDVAGELVDGLDEVR